MPVIYLLRTSPCVSSVLPSIEAPKAIGRTTLSRRFTRTCSLQREQPGDHPPAGGLLHTPSHPYPARAGRSFSSSLTSCHQLLLLSEVERPVLPGLSSRSSRQQCFHPSFKNQRQAGAVFLRMQKYTKKPKVQKLSALFLLPLNG